MSILVNMIAPHIVRFIEAENESHSPAIQAIMLTELQMALLAINNRIQKKLDEVNSIVKESKNAAQEGSQTGI